MIRGQALYPTATRQFLEESQQVLRTEASRRAYRTNLAYLQRLNPEKRVNEFKETDLVAFLNLPGASATVAQRRKIITKFFEWADWKDMLVKNPAVGLKRLVPIHVQPAIQHRWLSELEVKKLLSVTMGTDTASLRTRTVLLFGLLTGLRRTEIADLRWGQVDLHARSLTLTGKGGKLAQLSLPPQLVEHLMTWRGHVAKGLGRPAGPQDPVLPSFKSTWNAAQTTGIAGFQRSTEVEWTRALGQGGVAGIVADAGAAVGIPELRTHDLRRTFAGILEERGVSLPDISRAMRHSNVATTSRYLESNPRRTMSVTEGLVLEL